MVEYGYDAWGKVLYTKGSKAEGVGKDNPFRYRGYVYDEETQLYYLRSRYYDPEWGRFVGLDKTEILEADYENIRQNNLYAYCFNNPIRLVDDSGQWPSLGQVFKVIAVTAVVVAAAAIAVAASPALAVAGGGAIAMGVAEGALGAAGIYIVAGMTADLYEARKKSPNLPSAKRIKINMDHIMSGHGFDGKRGGPGKDRFPKWATAATIERIIREAYKYGERVKTQGDRVFIRGPWGNRLIEMWVNTVEKTIESAWPKY